MKHLFLFFLIAHSFNGLFAQQIPFFCQYNQVPLLYGPSEAGSGTGRFFLIHRDQWKDIQGSPVINAFTADGPVKNKKVGLGISVISSKQGITKTLNLKGNFSYKVILTENSRLYFGLGAGMFSHSFDFTKVIAQTEADPSFTYQVEKGMIPDADAGVSYYYKDLSVKITAFQLFGSKLNFANSSLNYQLERHYTGTASYNFKLNELKGIEFSPIVGIRSGSGVPFQYDINGILSWLNKGWFGLFWRSDYALGLNAGILFKSFKVGYAYELPVFNGRSNFGLSHEILIGYILKKKKEVATEPIKQTDEDELTELIKELQEKEEALKIHEKQILDLIDSFFKKANQMELKNDPNELDKLRKLKEDLDKIKEEERIYKNAKNIEIENLKQRIKELQEKKK